MGGLLDCRWRRSGPFLDCRVDLLATVGALAIEGSTAAIALNVHLEDGGVMNEAVDGGERHGLVWKDLAPFAEWLVGGDQHGAPLVAAADQLEQHAGLGLILADVDDVIEDQEMILVELGERAFQCELASRDLQTLYEIAGAHEQHAPSILDQSKSDGGCKMAFAAARRAEQQNVGALRKPAVARCERHHLRLADHRHRLELEVGERLAGGQSCFRQVTFDATTTAIGDLV